MSVLVSDNNQQHLLLCKGAPESVLGRCSHALLNSDGGGPVPMTDNIRRALLERMAQYGGSGSCMCLLCHVMCVSGMLFMTIFSMNGVKLFVVMYQCTTVRLSTLLQTS